MLGHCERLYKRCFEYLIKYTYSCNLLFYTSVGCYVIICNGYGCSGTEEGVVRALNNVLCLEIVPRESSYPHLKDREHQCNCYALYGINLSTNLEVVVLLQTITDGFMTHYIVGGTTSRRLARFIRKRRFMRRN